MNNYYNKFRNNNMIKLNLYKKNINDNQYNKNSCFNFNQERRKNIFNNFENENTYKTNNEKDKNKQYLSSSNLYRNLYLSRKNNKINSNNNSISKLENKTIVKVRLPLSEKKENMDNPFSRKILMNKNKKALKVNRKKLIQDMKNCDTSIEHSNKFNISSILNKEPPSFGYKTMRYYPHENGTIDHTILVRSKSKFDLLNNNILKSVYCSRNEENKIENLRYVKDNKSNIKEGINCIRTNLFSLIINQNKRCKLSLDMLRNHSSPQLNLPFISTKRDINFNYSFNPNGSNKYFGEKYNPYNYMMQNNKNRVKRNEYGTLFQH